MAVELLFFLIGLAMLLGGAELFVRGSSWLAGKIGVSSLVIGLTVVAFGTSAPELAIGIQSGFEGESDLLVGNVIGSNIFNVLMILGGSALIAPLLVDRKLVRWDVPLMIGVSLLLWVFCLNGSIGMVESILLTALLVAWLSYTILQGRKEGDPPGKAQNDDRQLPGVVNHWLFQVMLILIGLGLLIVGADWLVDSAVSIARYLGVSSVIVGLTVIAFGTSLPEAATALMAGLRGERDIAVGNVVGSNIFNILGILGISGMIITGSIIIPESVLALDIPLMTAVAVACLPIFFTGYVIDRWEGLVFIGYYMAYFAWLVLNAGEHRLLPLFNDVMLWFVLPLTVLTLAVILFQEFRKRRSGN